MINLIAYYSRCYLANLRQQLHKIEAEINKITQSGHKQKGTLQRMFKFYIYQTCIDTESRKLHKKEDFFSSQYQQQGIERKMVRSSQKIDSYSSNFNQAAKKHESKHLGAIWILTFVNAVALGKTCIGICNFCK